ncbi:MAG: phenylalanine--tRNA ligase subunit beta [Candidatus Cloacimonadota bacterium]|nr:MAG: phenylalanine--tRNA ligase subunit beta [Candidatus Cloacimonadota bacterium]PIE78696.1 MAG: phenylalanine--tRNA ligase subunit beta [Candidatus Delongbacteria bacterium]
MAMKISLNWLKDYVDFKSDTEKIVNKLTFLGFEIEKVEKIENNFDKIYVGKVLSKEKHPDAEKLSVCKVDVGEGDPLQIVCGAPNVAEGQTVPVATKGAVLGDLKIKNSKLRGVKSMGMICAEDELGIGEDHSGIMVLDDKYEAGTPFKELYGYEDTVLEADITSNRPDMFGYFGFGREFSVFEDTTLKKPEVLIKNEIDDISKYLEVVVEDTKACPRYSARVIKNVKVAPSPKWLQERLLAVGLRPINNVVDITNYVMMETGHPLHAFDLANLEGAKIVVKKGVSQKKFTTLDGDEYTINDDTLMINDAVKPVAIAGVMGGENSGVTSETKDVALEVAYFNFVDIRHATRDLNLSTDSAKRFERGVDPNSSLYVINRAASLIEEICCGEVIKDVIDIYPNKIDPVTIDLRVDRTNKILGFVLTQEVIKFSLELIDFTVKVVDDNTLSVVVPTFRPDVKKEIDLIEEVVRVYGYEKIPETTRSEFDLDISIDNKDSFIDSLKNDFIKLGAYETCSRTMQEAKYNKPFMKNWVVLEHPLNEELNSLRTSVLSSLLQCASRNLRYRNDHLVIFESGAIFEKSEDSIFETESLSLLIGGKRVQQSWNQEEVMFDFYDIKGYFEAIADLRSLKNLEYKPNEGLTYFDRDQSLLVFSGKVHIATLGKISDDVAETFEIETPVYGLDIYVDKLRDVEKDISIELQPVSKFPKVKKDISLLLDESMSCIEVMEVIKKYGGKKLRNIDVVDFYQGDQVENGKKSYTFRMVFQSDDSTLKEKEIDKMFNKVINGIKKEINSELR